MSEKKLVLIDGNSLLYRAFYAIQRLSSPQGFPTNAIYGFIITLRKILDREKPAYLGIVFDTPGPKLRHEVFKDYKAHRKPMPDDLAKQIPRLREIIRALRIPVFEDENYEADDVLGSLAKRAAANKFFTVVVSTDKDLLQLVDEATVVYNPTKEISLDEAKVKDTFGVLPFQVVDVLSLWGDASDNVPGVPGIGEKTAKSLIGEYGSLDNLKKNLGKMKNPRLREKIEQNLDKLELSRELVTIERNLDIAFDPEKFKVSEPDTAELARIFQDLGFTSLVSEYLKPPQKSEKIYAAITTENELSGLVSVIKKAGSVSLDTETDNVSPTRARLVGMSFSLEPERAYYLPLGHDYPGAPAQLAKEVALGLLREVLESRQIKKIGQNIKYDFIVLEREGIRLSGIDLDTMVLSYLLEPNWGKHNLDKLALTYLQAKTIAYNDVVGKGKNELTMNKVAVDRVTPYACQDADFALALSRILWPKVEAAKLDGLYREIEQPMIEVLAGMEMAGVKLDADALGQLSVELQAELSRLEKKIFELGGTEFNINSPQQLAHILFHKLNLPAARKTKITKGFSTSMDILQDLAPLHPLARHALEYRQMAKLKSTYADALPALINPETRRIHTSYNQTVASTGRLSSSDPNLQNIPARGEMGTRFRRAFVPEKGHLFLSADYSQIELRVLAHMSGDPALCESFMADRDIHEETALRVFGPASSLFKDDQRRKAKIINFSIIYGTSAFSLAKELQTSNSEAQNFINRYYEKHPKVKEFLGRLVGSAQTLGFSETLFGRRRPVPELRQSDKAVWQAGRRIALNMPIQGTAADLMKKAMIDIWREMGNSRLRSRMILQVHDELVFEVPEKEKTKMDAIVREKMEHVFPLSVPLKVRLGWGDSWAATK
jgi:DNA polymerase-1